MPEVLTREEAILRDGGQNLCSGHDSKGCYGFKSDVSYHGSSSEFYKHATANQFEPFTHILSDQQHRITENHVEGVVVFHLGSSYGQSHWGYSSAEKMRQGITPVKRDVENPEMPRHSYISYEINEADTHCAPLYMPDKCYRLYTEEFYIKEMSGEGIPEMQRSNLVSCVIQLKALGIDNIMGFDWLASPPPEAMVRALEVLYAIGVLDEDGKLTSPTGFQVAEVPLEPMISKMLLSSSSMGCCEEVLTIAAVLSVQSIWVSSKGTEKALDEVKDRFAAAEGDHITYLNVYEGFLRSNKSSQWCHRNLINYQAMKKVVEIRNQLRKLIQRLGVKINSSGKNTEVIRKAVTSGFFPHACRLEISSEAGKSRPEIKAPNYRLGKAPSKL
jgi:hypothetical protein